MSSLRARRTNCSVVGCINQQKCLYSVPATEQQKRQWLRLIFNYNMPATLSVSLHVCANNFTLDCFSNEGQHKAGFASTLTLIKGLVPTILDPATAPEPQVCRQICGSQPVSSASIRYALAFKAISYVVVNVTTQTNKLGNIQTH